MNMSALSMPVSKQQLFCASERPSGPLVQRALNPVALAHNFLSGFWVFTTDRILSRI
jgi:hypothetical protein